MKFTASLASFLALIGASVSAAKTERTFAVLRFNGKALVNTRLDPIVNPGTVSPHLHMVQGGSNFGPSSTGKDLLKSSCTNAKIKADFSNYWVPNLFFRDPKDGTLEPVEMFYTNAYYFFDATDDDIKAFPVGLSMLSGDPNLRTPPAVDNIANMDPAKGPVIPSRWTCPRSNYDTPGWVPNSNGLMAGIGDPNNKGEGIGFPVAECDGFASPLRADIHFPSCYNPDVDVADYKNNMVWPSSEYSNDGYTLNCPPGYIHTPHLFIEVYWNTPAFKDRWDHDGKTQPFVLSNGDATGYSLHADFMAAWDEDVLQHIIDTCNAGSVGMDKCPGIEQYVQEEQCTIENTIDEKITGVMEKLPGNNAITGWQYGLPGGYHDHEKGEPLPSASKSQVPNSTPTSQAPEQTQPPKEDDKSAYGENEPAKPTYGRPQDNAEDAPSSTEEVLPVSTSEVVETHTSTYVAPPSTTSSTTVVTRTRTRPSCSKPSTVWTTVTVTDAATTTTPTPYRKRSHRYGRHLRHKALLAA